MVTSHVGVQAQGALERQEIPIGCGDALAYACLPDVGTARLRLKLGCTCRCVYVRNGEIVGTGSNRTNEERNVRDALNLSEAG